MKVAPSFRRGLPVAGAAVAGGGAARPGAALRRSPARAPRRWRWPARSRRPGWRGVGRCGTPAARRGKAVERARSLRAARGFPAHAARAAGGRDDGAVGARTPSPAAIRAPSHGALVAAGGARPRTLLDDPPRRAAVRLRVAPSLLLAARRRRGWPSAATEARWRCARPRWTGRWQRCWGGRRMDGRGQVRAAAASGFADEPVNEDELDDYLLVLVDRGLLDFDLRPPLVGPPPLEWMRARLARLATAAAAEARAVRRRSRRRGCGDTATLRRHGGSGRRRGRAVCAAARGWPRAFRLTRRCRRRGGGGRWARAVADAAGLGGSSRGGGALRCRAALARGATDSGLALVEEEPRCIPAREPAARAPRRGPHRGGARGARRHRCWIPAALELHCCRRSAIRRAAQLRAGADPGRGGGLPGHRLVARAARARRGAAGGASRTRWAARWRRRWPSWPPPRGSGAGGAQPESATRASAALAAIWARIRPCVRRRWPWSRGPRAGAVARQLPGRRSGRQPTAGPWRRREPHVRPARCTGFDRPRRRPGSTGCSRDGRSCASTRPGPSSGARWPICRGCPGCAWAASWWHRPAGGSRPRSR